jgi:hypothetical protein
MANKYCTACGKVSSPQAVFCCSCGINFTIENSTAKRPIFRTTELLTLCGSIIALLGGIIGIIVSEQYSSVIGFTPMITTFFITSLFGLASFAYSTSGLILILRKNLGKSG